MAVSEPWLADMSVSKHSLPTPRVPPTATAWASFGLSRKTITAAWDLLCQTSRTCEGASSTFHWSSMMSSAVERLHLCFYVCVCIECSHGSVDWYYLFRISNHFIHSKWKLALHSHLPKQICVSDWNIININQEMFWGLNSLPSWII